MFQHAGGNLLALPLLFTLISLYYVTTQYGSFRQIFLLTQSLKFKLLLQIVCLRRLRLCKKVHTNATAVVVSYLKCADYLED